MTAPATDCRGTDLYANADRSAERNDSQIPLATLDTQRYATGAAFGTAGSHQHFALDFSLFDMSVIPRHTTPDGTVDGRRHPNGGQSVTPSSSR